MSPRTRHSRIGSRARLATLVVVAATTLVVGLAPAMASGTGATASIAAGAAARPASTPTFATWSSATTGTLGGANIEVTYDGPEFPAVRPLILDETTYFDPPGSATQQGLDYVLRPGSITFEFDAPVTNVAIYAYYLRTPATQGPPAYGLSTDGEGSWVRVSGNGLLAGSELLPTDDYLFVLNILAFSGTTTTLSIETLGDCSDCGSSQGLALASFDTIPSPAPSIDGVRPNTGPASGGTVITVEGEAFFGVTSVTVGGGACTEVQVIDEQTLTCAAPAGTAGPADVVVRALGGSATAAGAFTYIGAPIPPPPPTPDTAPVTPTFTG